MKLAIFALLGALSGFAGSFIPWGAPDGLHGVGLPVATVLWDAPNGTMIDYPNPLAYIFNLLVGIFLGCLTFGAYALLRKKSECKK